MTDQSHTHNLTNEVERYWCRYAGKMIEHTGGLHLCCDLAKSELRGQHTPALPSWMDSYRDLICNTGSNQVEDLLNRLEYDKNIARTNIVAFSLATAVQSQVSLLARLHKFGLLGMEKPPSNAIVLSWWGVLVPGAAVPVDATGDEQQARENLKWWRAWLSNRHMDGEAKLVHRMEYRWSLDGVYRESWVEVDDDTPSHVDVEALKPLG